MTENNSLHISNLKFSWSAASPLLLDISEFKLKAKEKVFLYGPSGSGKTTFLNLVTGVLNATSGVLEVLNTDLRTLSSSQRDEFRGNHMGFIFQQFNLIPYLTAYENIVLPLQFSKLKKSKITDIKLEAERLATRLNLNSLMNQKATELSVGQQQRVAAARALIGQPEIIIADEPTSSLDHDHRDQFLNLLLEEAQRANSSLIFVSHDKTLQSHFDRTLSLNELAGGRL